MVRPACPPGPCRPGIAVHYEAGQREVQLLTVFRTPSQGHDVRSLFSSSVPAVVRVAGCDMSVVVFDSYRKLLETLEVLECLLESRLSEFVRDQDTMVMDSGRGTNVGLRNKRMLVSRE